MKKTKAKSVASGVSPALSQNRSQGMALTLRPLVLGVVFWVGLSIILAYWVALHPPGFGMMGYGEDIGSIELSREIMADSLKNTGGPQFFTTRLMAPLGTSSAFFSWSLERDWIGAYFWSWSHRFPWLWVYLGLSLLTSYVGVGSILKKMFKPFWPTGDRSTHLAWGLAALVVFFNVPRHHKANHHYEHLIQHWFYLGIFLDAWIWQKFWRDRKWSFNLEAWRGFCLLGTFNLGGYCWSAMILEWLILRFCLISTWIFRKFVGNSAPIEIQPKKLILPFCLGIALISAQLRWYLPLLAEVRSLGPILQAMGWEADLALIFRPIWVESLLQGLGFLSTGLRVGLENFLRDWKVTPFGQTETVVTMGWTFLIPMIYGLWVIRKKKPGLGLYFPFLCYLVFLVMYSCVPLSYGMQDSLADIFPFLKFFRVVSRTGLFMPIVAGVLIALAAPEMTAHFSETLLLKNKSGFRFRFLCGAFLLSTIAEWGTFWNPITTMPPMNEKMEAMLAKIHDLPGTTVLNMPFCVAGGNAVCTTQQCPNYPHSVTSALLTGWHEKNVYGIYLARLVPSQCSNYNQDPFLSWFDAWRSQRCLMDFEMDSFCDYLDQHSETSAVMIFSGLWTATARPECRAKFDARLGPPLDEADLFTSGSRGGEGRDPSHVLWYGPKCKRK